MNGNSSGRRCRPGPSIVACAVTVLPVSRAARVPTCPRTSPAALPILEQLDERAVRVRQRGRFLGENVLGHRACALFHFAGSRELLDALEQPGLRLGGPFFCVLHGIIVPRTVINAAEPRCIGSGENGKALGAGGGGEVLVEGDEGEHRRWTTDDRTGQLNSVCSPQSVSGDHAPGVRQNPAKVVDDEPSASDCSQTVMAALPGEIVLHLSSFPPDCTLHFDWCDERDHDEPIGGDDLFDGIRLRLVRDQRDQRG